MGKTYLYKTLSMGRAEEAQDRAEAYSMAAGLVSFSVWARNALDKASGFKSKGKAAKSNPGVPQAIADAATNLETSQKLIP